MRNIKWSFVTVNTLVFIIILGASVNIIAGQTPPDKNSEAQILWEKISPYFSPPGEFIDKYGDYRSPLKFYNGQMVRTPGEWKKRREEILDRWNNLMGEWPPFIEKQKIEILETTHKEGFTQHHIRF